MSVEEEQRKRKETPAPYCHGEHMVPIYSYRAKNGVIYREWACSMHNCGNLKTLPLYTEELK